MICIILKSICVPGGLFASGPVTEGMGKEINWETSAESRTVIPWRAARNLSIQTPSHMQDALRKWGGGVSPHRALLSHSGPGWTLLSSTSVLLMNIAPDLVMSGKRAFLKRH